MPTYQYACTACGEPHEAVQSFTDAPLTECPACGGRLRKVFSAVGVVFKGSGFYKNDSRSQVKGKGSGDGDGSGTGSSEGAAAKADGANKGDGAGKSDGPSKGDGAGKSDGPSKSDGGAATKDSPAAAKTEGSSAASGSAGRPKPAAKSA